jgi:hypothetical protein
MGRLTLGAGLVLVAMLLCEPAGASAGVRIGSDLTSLSAAAICTTGPCSTGNYALIQTRVPAPARPNSPYQGVVTRWSAIGAGPLRLFVARYREDDVAVRLATTSVRTALGRSKVSSFATRLPIAKGDFIGLFLESRASQLAIRGNAPNTSFDAFPGGLGATWLRSPQPDVDWELGYNATVEPDLDGDGYGDETQDLCPSDRATAGPCPPPPDVTAPSFLRRPSVAPRRVGRRAATLSVALSEDATIAVRLYRARRGGGPCDRAHHARTCRRWRFVKSLVHAGHAGENAVPLLGRGRKRAGRYRVAVRATDAAGNASSVARATLRVIRRSP